jgi:hypothetical protein
MVAGASALSGAGECSHVEGAGDPVCLHLVRALSERMGLFAALATVVIVLTMVGLSRMAAEGAPRR